MDQKKRDKIAWVLAAVLIPVLVYLLAVNFFGAGERGGAPVPAPGSGASGIVSPASVSLSAPEVRRPEGGLDPETLAKQREIAARVPVRNPFMIPAGAATEPKTPVTSDEAFKHRVTAIIHAPGSSSRMAMINGRMYEEGDRIGAWTILRVDPQHVVFDDGVKRRIVGVK